MGNLREIWRAGVLASACLVAAVHAGAREPAAGAASQGGESGHSSEDNEYDDYYTYSGEPYETESGEPAEPGHLPAHAGLPAGPTRSPVQPGCAGCVYSGGPWNGHSCCKDWLFSPCRLRAHFPYFPPLHGHYYFRPYHVARVLQQQRTVPIWGGDPRNPYDNTMLDDVYEQWREDRAAEETVPAPEPEPNEEEPAEELELPTPTP